MTDDQVFIPKETMDAMMTRAFIELAAKLERLEKELATAQSRIRELEGQVYGGTTQ